MRRRIRRPFDPWTLAIIGAVVGFVLAACLFIVVHHATHTNRTPHIDSSEQPMRNR